MKDLEISILIVCEGDSTEPEYLKGLRDFLLPKYKKVHLTIYPKPKSDNTDGRRNERIGGKRKELKIVDAETEDLLKKLEIEEEFKAQPLCYVRKAQKGLMDSTYNHAWAVFDKDGHPVDKPLKVTPLGR